jgi:hypothetical protein
MAGYLTGISEVIAEALSAAHGTHLFDNAFIVKLKFINFGIGALTEA